MHSFHVLLSYPLDFYKIQFHFFLLVSADLTIMLPLNAKKVYVGGDMREPAILKTPIYCIDLSCEVKYGWE